MTEDAAREIKSEQLDMLLSVHLLPGYTHNIINLSETENLVTVMWANEQFDSKNPDTFGEKVYKSILFYTKIWYTFCKVLG